MNGIDGENMEDMKDMRETAGRELCTTSRVHNYLFTSHYSYNRK
jgi:hypothetical protein